MKRILVPTDFSPTAEKAFRYALELAAQSQGKIFLFHVYTPVESPFIETVEVRREYNLEREQALMHDIDLLVMSTQGASGLKKYCSVPLRPVCWTKPKYPCC